MSIRVSIPIQVLKYSEEQLRNWKDGERADCQDPYCLRLRGSYGFGEYIVGSYFNSLGYEWIHHDFDVFGGNKPGKYPKSEEILLKCLGKEEFDRARTIYKTFPKIEHPDLLIYKQGFSQIRFAESKRIDTRDKLRHTQIRGLVILSYFLGYEVDVFAIVREDKDYVPQPIMWEL
jgi:hypothetical protein